MTRRYTGGFISATEQATDANTANGVFSLQEAGALTAAGNFPTGNWVPQQSIRFRASASAYLKRSFSTTGTGAGKLFTFSCWVKRSKFGGSQFYNMFGSNTGTNAFSMFAFDSTDTLVFRIRNSSSVDVVRVESNDVFRDPSAWYHCVVAYDADNSSTNRRCRLFVNGRELTYGTYTTTAGQALTGTSATDMQIGRGNTNNANMYYSDFYLSEYNFIDGQALDPSYFGTTHPVTGTWIPKRYTGAYGTNGFNLSMSEDTSFAADYMVVAGGGGGGSNRGGGGGAGGYRTSIGGNGSGGGSSLEPSISLSTGVAYTITVGAGGGSATNGNNSVLASITSIGGGRGEGATSGSGSTGGSGGGGSGDDGTGLAGTSAQGYAGGNGEDNGGPGRAGGGGGGAGHVGYNAGASGTYIAGNGGYGLPNPFAGSTIGQNSGGVYYLAGGGGGGYLNNGVAGTAGTGGLGGGGNGASASSGGTGGSASANTGGGGGGSAAVASGGSGGSGAIIFRIPETRDAFFSSGVTVGSPSISGGYKTYTVTATSTTSETVIFA